MPGSNLSSTEIARRGEELFEREIRSRLEPEARGKFLALDVETGHFEIDQGELAAVRRARAHRAEAPLYVL